MMTLVQVIIEASRTGEFPRVNTRAARTIAAAIAEWLEDPARWGRGAVPPEFTEVAKHIRDEIHISRRPK